MKLSVKALLPLAILLSGSVNCTQLTVDERDVLKSEIDHAMNFEESLVMALEHPSLLIKPKLESGAVIVEDVFKPEDELFTFEKWAHYLHDTNVDAAKTRKERISKDAAYKFYYLDLSSEEIADLRAYFEANPKETTLDKLDNDELKAKIEGQFQIKKKYLETIMSNLPVIKDYFNANGDDNTSKIIKSHIDEFIANALMFDYKRFNFSGLHPVIEGIKGAIEVPRKAKHGAEAAYKAIDDPSKDIVEKKKKAEKFTIKRKIPEDPKKPETEEELKVRMATEKARKEKSLREINILNVAFESANRSTSNPDVLFYTLNGSLLLMTILIAHNAITAKSTDDEEGEGDEESGEAH